MSFISSTRRTQNLVTRGVIIGICIVLAGLSLRGNADTLCDVLTPGNATIAVTLTDAELRTDQNISCAYISRICPDIFLDNNGNGIKDGIDSNIAGLTVRLMNATETAIIAQYTSDTEYNTCFAPLSDATTYRVRIFTPPTPFSTTGGDFRNYTITNGSGITLAPFGYSNGALSLTVPASVTFPTTTTRGVDQTVSTVVPTITVSDTRLAAPGWTVTATVENFVSTDTLTTLPIANAFTSDPQTITTLSGSSSGITRGATKTVISTTDPFDVISAATTNGTGEYTLNDNISLIVPKLTPAKTYQSVITFTII
jgi:hypothetical protein